MTNNSGAFQYDQIGRLISGGGTFTYDDESRLTSGDTWNASSAGDADCHSGGAVAPGFPPPPEHSYYYDGLGQVAQDTLQSGGSRRWVWNGSAPLYVMPVTYAYNGASGPGAPYGFAADGVGFLTPDGSAPGLTISDTDFDGAVTQYHNSTGHSTWAASNPYNQFCQHATPLPASAGYGQISANATPVDGSSDPSLKLSSTGRAYLSRSMGFTTPDYSSATPYAPSRRQTRGFQDKRPTEADAGCTSGVAWVNPDGSHECIPMIGSTGTTSGHGGPGLFGGDATTALPFASRKPPPACLKGDYLSFSISKGSIDMSPGPGISIGATLSKQGVITPNLWLGVGVGAGPTTVVGDVQKPVGGSIDDFPPVTLNAGAFAATGQSLTWAGQSQYAYEQGVGFPQAFAGLQFSVPQLSQHSQSVADLFCK